MLITIAQLLLCHMMGDYVFQSEFIALTKKNWYHLFVHSTLYCALFALIFGINYKLLIIFISHMIIDSLKARYNKISYTQDQILHYLMCLIYLF